MKNCIKLFLVVSLFVVVLSAPASNTTYDQRQQGKYNIHLNIKDVAIITFDSDTISGELGDDSSYDEDYDYDYDQLTINPVFEQLISGAKPNKTTQKPDATITTTITPTTKKPIVVSNSKPEVVSHKPEFTLTSVKPAHEMTANTGDMNVALPDKKPINVVIIKDKDSEKKKDEKMPEQIPVQVIMEPVLKLRSRTNNNSAYTLNRFARKPSVQILNNEKSVRNVRNSDKCGKGQFKDKSGKCRMRRSRRSGINQLISLIKSMTKGSE